MTEIGIVAVCLLPTAVMGWVALKMQSKLQAENKTLIAAVLSLSEKPAAEALGHRMEAQPVEPQRMPLRRPHAGAG